MDCAVLCVPPCSVRDTVSSGEEPCDLPCRVLPGREAALEQQWISSWGTGNRQMDADGRNGSRVRPTARRSKGSGSAGTRCRRSLMAAHPLGDALKQPIAKNVRIRSGALRTPRSPQGFAFLGRIDCQVAVRPQSRLGQAREVATCLSSGAAEAPRRLGASVSGNRHSSACECWRVGVRLRV